MWGTKGQIMNQEIKKRWVEALRDGTYKQGREVLKSYDGYCCLGVLTDLFCHEKGLSWEEALSQESEFEDDIYDNELLPPLVREWASLKEDPVVDGINLSTRNDGSTSSCIEAESFVEIANAIEKSNL